MKRFDYTTFLSPFTWRYGSNEMRKIWSEVHKRELWRTIWVELAKTQNKEGLISKEELYDLIKHQQNIDIERSHEIEKEIHHDLMAEIKTYASQTQKGGGKIHLGATSMDIEDNTDTVRYHESLKIVENKLKTLLATFAKQIEKHKNTLCMAYTHLQPAEPTTLGYRFSFYAQDLLFDLKLLEFVQTMLKGKGFKGAVGTSAGYVALLNEEKAMKLEQTIMKQLGIDSVLIANQTSPRKLEHFLSMFLSSLAQTLYKFAFDVRLMQSPGFGEWQEPFGEKQVGSSAMPFKRNPIKSEQICSLARFIFQTTNVPLENAALMGLERTLDDSANRRVVFPEMFLALDEMLQSATNIIENLVINHKQIKKNVEKFGSFAATESILMEAVKRGGDRQLLHDALRENALKAYESMQNRDINNLELLLKQDSRITNLISKEKIKTLLNPRSHIGLASQKCEDLLKLVKKY